jgi:hypothetical protein
MSRPPRERALELLDDSHLADISAAWAAVYILLTEGHAPLVRRCCAVWACHAVLRHFDGNAADRARLRHACRLAYRHACGRAKDSALDAARQQALEIAETATGAAFQVAAAVVRVCTRALIPIHTSVPDRPLLVPAAFDVPWLAALAGDAHAAWAAYRRHLRRAVRALPPR